MSFCLFLAESSYSIASVVTPQTSDKECNFIKCTTRKNATYMICPTNVRIERPHPWSVLSSPSTIVCSVLYHLTSLNPTA